MQDQFFTLKGYDRRGESPLTPAMEDYLEMIFRLGGSVRVKTLAGNLNVSPPSASKMAENLRTRGYVSFERYGLIELTGKGKEYGGYLLRRHDIVRRFLRALNGEDESLEEAERLEHCLRPGTVQKLEALIQREQW